MTGPVEVTVEGVVAGTRVPLDPLPYVVQFVRGYRGDFTIRAYVNGATLEVLVDGQLAVTAPAHEHGSVNRGHAVRADLDGVTYEIVVERIPDRL